MRIDAQKRTSTMNTKDFAEHTYVWLALYKSNIVVFKTKHGAEQWITSLDYPEGWAISCYRVFEDEE